jgi:hypothetical protein
LRDSTAAGEEFQKIIDYRGLVLVSPVGAMVHLGLARANALQGDREKARADYEDFLTLSQDADPDMPILKAGQSGVREAAIIRDYPIVCAGSFVTSVSRHLHKLAPFIRPAGKSQRITGRTPHHPRSKPDEPHAPAQQNGRRVRTRIS